jgi:outer membrane protein assembly factor BamB
MWLEIPGFVLWLTTLGALAVLLLAFTIWWLTNRRIPGRDRLWGLAAAVGGGVAWGLLSQKVGVAWFTVVLPWLFTVWAVWLLVARRMSPPTRRTGLVIALLLLWGLATLIRYNGLRGSGKPDLNWRWTPMPEELAAAERAQHKSDPVNLSSSPLQLQSGDWPGFRGPQRDGVVRGEKIAVDWQANLPNKLWRHRVGPGWSSFAVVGDRLFTQEQRGQDEAVVCLDAAKGWEIWSHLDAARFTDDQAGLGPRATPTFADGRLYTLGATGILNCLDAATGKRQWSHNIAEDAGGPRPPVWGYVCSPLVIRGLVVVYAGGEGDKGLLAYRADSGTLAWSAAASANSFSSPQRATLCGEEQILFAGNKELIALDPATGKVLWQQGISTRADMPRSLQAHPIGSTQVAIASQAEGAVLFDLKRDRDAWTVSQLWAARSLKPSFNDFVIHDDAIYGFDGDFFTCVDARTGERHWREGRYEHGQALLLADQALLLVVAEDGQVILLAANPDEHRELGRFQAIEGKTWNHPVIAHGRLYVRNAEEIACYDLRPAGTH